MVDAQASASVIVAEGSVAQDMGAKATALAGEAGIASATLDRGLSGIVEVDIAATADAGTKEVDSYHIGTNTGGNFTLSVDGVTTAAIAFNAAASAVKAALEALPNVNTVTVTGVGSSGDPWIITFDDPVAPLAITKDGSGLTGGAGDTLSETTPGVAPVASTGSTAITNAIAAVADVQLRDGAVDLVENPVPVADNASPSISVNDGIAKVAITSTIVGTGEATTRLFYVVGGAVAATPSWVDFAAHDDPVRGSNHRSGEASIIFNEDATVANGTYVFVIEVEDANGGKGYEVVTLTVTNQS